jgi:hypothetical protein
MVMGGFPRAHMTACAGPELRPTMPRKTIHDAMEARLGM